MKPTPAQELAAFTRRRVIPVQQREAIRREVARHLPPENCRWCQDEALGDERLCEYHRAVRQGHQGELFG